MKKIEKIILSCAAFASTVLGTIGPNVTAEELVPSPLPKRDISWYQDARFGMFFQLGLYSTYGGFWKGEVKKTNNCAEWLMIAAQANRLEYGEAAKVFNPTKFDPQALAKTMKDAGIKYIVLAAKHHEGFAMFATKASKYNVIDASPYGKDILALLLPALRAEGIKIGIYYSQNLDWYHPGGGGNWHTKDSDFPDYGNDKKNNKWYVNNIVIPQLTEILTNYGKIDYLWYDIVEEMDFHLAEKIHKRVNKLAPDMIVNNRLSQWHKGEVQTPEKIVPPNGMPGKVWESCITINGSWGYASDDHRWKSSAFLVQQLCDISSKGGNYLLNIGPKPDGTFPAGALERLDGVGAWMDKNSEVVYGTRASIFPNFPAWGRFATRYGKEGSNSSALYAIVYETPDSKQLQIPGIKNAIKSVTILDNKQALNFKSVESTLTIDIPAERLGAKKTADGLAVAIGREDNLNFKTPPSVHDEVKKQVEAGQRLYVVKIELEGAVPTVSKRVYPNVDGHFELLPSAAECTGKLRLKPQEITGWIGGRQIIEQLDFWINDKDSAKYAVHINEAGKYDFSFQYSNAAQAKGSIIRFSFQGEGAPVNIDYTFSKTSGNWGHFITGGPIPVELKQGDYDLTVSIVKKNGTTPCNLSTIYIMKAK